MIKPILPTAKDPTDPNKLYFRLMFSEFFYGPFDLKDDVSKALAEMDAWNEQWCYDSFCVIRGACPLPNNYVSGFPLVTSEERQEIELKRGKYLSELKHKK